MTDRATTDRAMTRKNAERLTLTIRAYWLNRGKNVGVWAERLGKDFVVRSDMLNGEPRNFPAVSDFRDFA
tara:strand:+ start:79 stop:288 length:210 start_codon:yes stop_codon:yes gene_type:complete